MKLEMKITERDKKLLIFLAVIVILFLGGYCGVKPILTARARMQQEVTKQEDIKKKNLYKIQRLGSMELERKQVKKKIKTVKANFYDMMPSNAIDKMFTSKALKRNLEVYDLNISMPGKDYEITPYPYSKEAIKIALAAKAAQQKKDAESKPSEKKAAAAENAANNEAGIENSDSDADLVSGAKAKLAQGVSVASVTMNLTGDVDDLKAFIDELTVKTYKIRLTSFAFADQDNASMDNGIINMKKVHALTVNFEVYMYDKKNSL